MRKHEYEEELRQEALASYIDAIWEDSFPYGLVGEHISEAIGDISEDKLFAMYSKPDAEFGKELRQAIQDYWDSIVEKQAQEKMQTEKADAMRAFLEMRYTWGKAA